MHDKHGNKLVQGDQVLLVGTIESMTANVDMCNITVKIPAEVKGKHVETFVTINTDQVQKVEPVHPGVVTPVEDELPPPPPDEPPTDGIGLRSSEGEGNVPQNPPKPELTEEQKLAAL